MVQENSKAKIIEPLSQPEAGTLTTKCFPATAFFPSDEVCRWSFSDPGLLQCFLGLVCVSQSLRQGVMVQDRAGHSVVGEDTGHPGCALVFKKTGWDRSGKLAYAHLTQASLPPHSCACQIDGYLAWHNSI